MTRIEMLELSLEANFGWFVVRDGKRLAALSAPRFVDMFWVSYVIEPLVETPEERTRAFQNEFWEPPGLTFSNRLTGAVAPHAFSSAAGLDGNRVMMRALSVAPEISLFDRAVLQVRRLWRVLSRSARYAHALRMREARAEIRRRSA